MVIIEYRIERLNPLRIDISIINDPANGLVGFFNHLTSTCCQDTILEFTGIVVHKSEELLSGHRLGVHDVARDRLSHLLVGHLENFPNSCLTTAGRSNDDDSHSLFGSFIELQNFLYLFVNVF